MNNILKFVRSPLIFGSFVILIGSLAANIGHYIFNLSIGRLLTTEQYGLTVSLISLTTLFAVFQMSMTGIFAKFAAKFQANNDKESFSDLIKKGFWITIIIAAIIVLILILISGLLAEFLHVSNILILGLTFSFVFLTVITALPTGILQGQLRVYVISALNITVAVLKIVIGLGLIILGYQVVGAMIGIVISLLTAYLIAMYAIRKKIIKKSSKKNKEEKLLVKELKDYGVKFFFATLGITIFTSMDVVLARHFFTPTLAGQYAALSIMGKAIFYLTFPINFIFFPLIAQKKEKGESVNPTLIFATVLILIVSVAGSIFYFLYPGIILKIFFPSPSYKSLAAFLGPMSIYFLIFSVASLFNSYLLSIGKTQIYKINIFAGVLLTVLIVFFHKNLFQIIEMLFISSFLLLILLLLYYWYNGRD